MPCGRLCEYPGVYNVHLQLILHGLRSGILVGRPIHKSNSGLNKHYSKLFLICGLIKIIGLFTS